MKKETILNNLIALNTTIHTVLTEEQLWDRLLSQKEWDDPFKSGTLTINGFKDALNRNRYSWPNSSLVYANLFKLLNASYKDVLDIMIRFAKIDPYMKDKNRTWFLEVYLESLTNINHKITFKDISSYIDILHLKLEDSNLNTLLPILKKYQDQIENKSEIHTYLVNYTKQIFKNTYKYIKDYNLEKDDYSYNKYDPIHEYKGISAKFDIYLNETKEQSFIQLAKEIGDYTSILYFINTKQISLSEGLNHILKATPNILLDYNVIDQFQYIIEQFEPDIIQNEFKKTPKLENLIKKQILQKEETTNTDLQMMMILEYGKIDTSDIKEHIIKNRRYDYLDFTYETNLIKHPHMQTILDTWLELDFKNNSNLIEFNKAYSLSEITEILKNAKWLPEKLVQKRKNIDNTLYIKYAAAIDKQNSNWPQIMINILQDIQTGKTKSRTAIKILKDSGYPVKSPVPQAYSDTDAFLYAITGNNPKSIRDAAKLLELKVASEEFRDMVKTHLIYLQKDNNIQKHDFSEEIAELEL